MVDVVNTAASGERVAIVTGAANGIGRAMTLAFARNGARVAAVDLDGEALQQLAERVGKDAILPFPGDATSPDTPRRIADTVVNRFGRIDILVNNVGGLIGGGGVEASLQDWNATLGLSLTSHFLFCQAVTPSMMAAGFGRIINISSNAGKFRGNTGISGLSYATAKGGLLQMTRSLAHMLGRHGITVNAIAPGSVLSGPGVKETAGMPEDLRARVFRETPLGYFAEPEEMASIALFLASPDASYVTGAAILANGGWCTV